jgi:hypothetical protein
MKLGFLTVLLMCSAGLQVFAPIAANAAEPSKTCYVTPSPLANLSVVKKSRKTVTLKVEVKLCDNASLSDLNSDTCMDGELKPLGGFTAQIYRMNKSRTAWDFDGGVLKTNSSGRAQIRLPSRKGQFYIGNTFCCRGKNCPVESPEYQLTSFLASRDPNSVISHLVFRRSR